MNQEPTTLYKLMVLYMLNCVNFPLTTAQIAEFILDRDYTNFLTLQTVFSDLTETGLAHSKTILNRTQLSLTEEGKNTLHYFENRISDAIKDDIRDYFTSHRLELRNESSIQCDYYKLVNGEYEAQLVAKDGDVDLCISGDLLDEIVGASLTMREFDIPFMGVYNACATFAESLILAASLIDGGNFERIICSTSSHFCTAERQYRYPLELGNQRTPLSQWTATGVGATMLNRVKGKIRIDCATIGRVVDYGVKDANDMGACMAPAARETLLAHLEGSSRDVDYYDLILTGDLGEAGSGLLRLLMEEKGVKLGEKYRDCGVLLFNKAAQDVGQGGSGAACSSSVFNSYVYKKMMCGELKRVLLIPTGALCSKTSTLQGESVPGIAHAVSFTLA